MHVKVPVKIVCRCGQKYSFDVYPLRGCMPSPVQCPVCGVDGTEAANEIIARTLSSPPLSPALYPQSLAAHAPLPVDAGDDKLEVELAIWRQRALEAERRVEQVQSAARAELAPHLIQVLKETVVQELAAQRRELLNAQEEAVMEISTMIRRFDSVQTTLREHLCSYEARIQELEKELSVLNAENRELLKLKIEMIRRQLEAERDNRMQFIPN